MKYLNSIKPDHNQSESGNKDQNASQPATFQIQTNQHQVQQQGQGNAQLYNTWSPQVIAQLKRAPGTPEEITAVAQRLGGRRWTLRTWSPASSPYRNLEVATPIRELQDR